MYNDEGFAFLIPKLDEMVSEYKKKLSELGKNFLNNPQNANIFVDLRNLLIIYERLAELANPNFREVFVSYCAKTKKYILENQEEQFFVPHSKSYLALFKNAISLEVSVIKKLAVIDALEAKELLISRISILDELISHV